MEIRYNNGDNEWLQLGPEMLERLRLSGESIRELVVHPGAKVVYPNADGISPEHAARKIIEEREKGCDE
jgi:hypothetical protein